MKTKEELNALKEEVENLNKKPAELSEEELQLVSGGALLGKDDVFIKIQGILETKLGLSVGSVCASSSIVDDLGADSLDVVDILKSTEEIFQFKFSQTRFENIKTVQDLCNLVQKNI